MAEKTHSGAIGMCLESRTIVHFGHSFPRPRRIMAGCDDRAEIGSHTPTLMLRRAPEAVIIAHVMDPSRKEVFVEGLRDRLFLTWLLSGTASSGLVVEIGFVDLPEDTAGGERGRLVEFVRLVGHRNVQIRAFADADWDRLFSRPVPNKIWLTDHRDLEGYVLREECIEKVLKLGACTERISPSALLTTVRRFGRRLGIVRLMSELDNLKLPFQATKLRRHLDMQDGTLSLDLEGYLRALLQNARISLATLSEILERIQEVETIYASTPDSELIHGKDTMQIVDAVLSKVGLKPGEGERLLWTSFEARFVEEPSNLKDVLGFLQA